MLLKEIEERRSIRKFKQIPVDRQELLDILESGCKAPSSKNRQPWKFVVVEGDAKAGMFTAFRNGIEREAEGTEALLPLSREHLAGAGYTLSIMEQAPVTVFIFQTLGTDIFAERTKEEIVAEICNLQSVSAAIQNMTLEAAHKGLGSLWICDIFFAYQELCDWLQTEGELIAALSIGYPDEMPPARPRRAVEAVTVWKS
ncbi:MAG: nitroreductase family protein [Eubacteriales bacterium]|nr:nitroreductase family protein [Eubacteriales bacterium]